MVTCLDNRLLIHWEKIPLLPVQDGILGPNVPGFQQTFLLELGVSVNDLGTIPVNGMVMGSRMFRQGRLDQVCTCQGSSVLIQSVPQCSTCLTNVHF